MATVSAPKDQKVTFGELFFDLVFVFCVTQVVSLLHDGVTWRSVGEVVLVFWLVWWGWTQFTWALNAADTTHPRVEVARQLLEAAGAVGVNEPLNLLVFRGFNDGFGRGP